jgi:peptide/bleomycin uptake transporter
MFKSFFLNKKWFIWSILGSAAIFGVTWYKVQLDVKINEWFGTFYNTIQEALGNPGTIAFDDFLSQCLTFVEIAGIYIVVAVLLEFYVKHYVFRWRTAMNDYYMANWDKLRHIEGAAQRVQEDTMRFAKIMETLGIAFLRSVMMLVAFLPILWGLSEHVKELPWIGHVEQAFVFIAIISATCGTALLAAVGIKLPGLEFNNQRVEAAYRKELVLGEDHQDRASPPSIKELYNNVRKNYYTLYLHYLYFDVAKWSYLQFTVIVPYIAMGPTIVAGAITLGIMQQVIRAFGKVEESFQFLVNSWSTIVELMSIHKRLKAFENEINSPSPEAVQVNS